MWQNRGFCATTRAILFWTRWRRVRFETDVAARRELPKSSREPNIAGAMVLEASVVREARMWRRARMLAQAFVEGRLDYCNCLLYGVSEDLLQRLQSVQNAAARFIIGARKYDHITLLRDLHWITLKIVRLMYQCLNGLAPPYRATDCIAISTMPGQRQLRFATAGQLYIPRTKTNDIWIKVDQGLWSHNLEWFACQIERFFNEQNHFQKIAWNIFIRWMTVTIRHLCFSEVHTRRNVPNEWIQRMHQHETSPNVEQHGTIAVKLTLISVCETWRQGAESF